MPKSLRLRLPVASTPIGALLGLLGEDERALMGEEGDAGALGVEPVLVRLGGGGRGDAKEQDAEQPAGGGLKA
jgi:hypothetical protein